MIWNTILVGTHLRYDDAFVFELVGLVLDK